MSQYEDTTVEELDVGNLSDEQLRDIAENDTRTTAQEKAQAELNRRDSADAADTEATPATDTTDEERGYALPATATETVTAPSGEQHTVQPAKEDAGTLRDSTGDPYKAPSLEVGAGQVQHQVDLQNASGVFPASGDAPDASLTVAGVTGNTELQDIADKGGTASEDAAGIEDGK